MNMLLLIFLSLNSAAKKIFAAATEFIFEATLPRTRYSPSFLLVEHLSSALWYRARSVHVVS